MIQARNPGGFSFELSESAPPVQTSQLTPIGDLDLDLGEFKTADKELSPIPELALSGAPPVAEIPEAWPASPFSPLAPPAEARPAVAPSGIEAPPQSALDEPAEPAELMFNLGPAAPATVDAAAPPVAPALIAPEPAPVIASAPSVTSTIAKTAAAPSGAPTIKKIQFPAASKRPVRSVAAPAPKSNPTTRFSASISQRAPAVALSDRDSDPFLDGIDDDAQVSAARGSQDDQALPEDLLPFSPAQPLTPGAGTTATWESETPTTRELWHSARRAWHATSRHAVTWSGHGLRSAQKLARNVHHKLQTRLEAQAQAAQPSPAQQPATGQQQPVAPSKPARAVPGPGHAPPMGTAQTLYAQLPGTDQARATPRFPAARRLNQQLLKNAAAPLCAVAAASVVYLAGSHFLGGDGKIALNSSRWAGPAVPDLGSLPGGQEQKTARSGAFSKPAAPSPAKVPPMVSEITALPEGLSWPGKGLIEVVTSEDELIYIDGVFTGRGPLRRVPVTPGKHDVAIKSGGEERTGSVVVEAEKNTRAVFTGQPITAQAP